MKNEGQKAKREKVVAAKAVAGALYWVIEGSALGRFSHVLCNRDSSELAIQVIAHHKRS